MWPLSGSSFPGTIVVQQVLPALLQVLGPGSEETDSDGSWLGGFAPLLFPGETLSTFPTHRGGLGFRVPGPGLPVFFRDG